MKIIFHSQPQLVSPRLIMGFSGWMDGGYVSTGSIIYLRNKFGASSFAEIDPEPFYILNVPGSMEEVAQFRPYIKIVDGVISEFQFPENIFSADLKNNLILFSGKEPHLCWREYAGCLFSICKKFNVQEIFFLGSVSGLTPHTREPRIFYSVNHEKLKEKLHYEDVHPTEYEGSSSFATSFAFLAREHGIDMINLVADVPMYIHAANPSGIHSLIKLLAHLLNIELDFTDLIHLMDQFNLNLDEALRNQKELAEQIKKLEENYDKEIVTDDQNFQDWLKRHGINEM
ncbi:MAG: PAC2 family protein [Candidatus Atribacteria bacterium]|nr:PAC2 family protein [Candidatus Atribacteria bacterium]